jgi:S1-C subfamily serine protease
VESTGAKYKIITKDDKEYDVTNIYRDPANDLAILKVNATLPEAMVLGDSDKNKVGQFVIAIGTALGEFRHTVTTGVISGLGRGIEAGDGWGGSVEQLDNVIQTDAAINPGNSGGPLLNSAGQVIGVNVAVSQSGQNIGFALPINVVKSSLDNFNKTGQFNRPYLGVQYKVISKESALMNEVPEGAYVAGVVSGSPAETAGIKQGDIITKLGGKSVKDTEGGLVGIINQSKVGDTLDIEVFRDKKTQTLKVTLKSADQ